MVDPYACHCYLGNVQHVILSNIAAVHMAVKVHAPQVFWQRGELELVVAAVDGEDMLAHVLK